MADKELEDRKHGKVTPVFVLSLVCTYNVYFQQKKWYLDVKSTPCARGSLINGISGGGVLGVAYYYLRGGYN